MGKYAPIVVFAGRMAIDDGDPADRARGPYYTKTVREFLREYAEHQDDVTDYSYLDTLEVNNIAEADVARERIDLDTINYLALVAMITYYVRKDRFCEGSLTEYALDGWLDKCLTELKKYDERLDWSEEHK